MNAPTGTPGAAEWMRERAARYQREHPATQGGREPPRDEGERLATLQRVARDGAATELRVSWASYEGKPYLSLRLWEKHADGSWWPSKGHTLSVRVSELGTFAEGIAAAMERADEHQARQVPGR